MKKIIRLTENDVHNIIKESVKKILREYDYNDDIEDFEDYGDYEDNYSDEVENIWWSPEKGFAKKPTCDGLWLYVTLIVTYSYESDGQMTEFGWHEDGNVNAESCQVDEIEDYNVINGKAELLDEPISDELYEKYKNIIENNYLK